MYCSITAVHFIIYFHSGLKKKILAASKLKECEDITRWNKSLTNHLYWVAASTPDVDGDVMWAMWKSEENHIHHVHEGHSDVFPTCAHETLDGDQRRKKWIKPGKLVNQLSSLMLTGIETVLILWLYQFTIDFLFIFFRNESQWKAIGDHRVETNAERCSQTVSPASDFRGRSFPQHHKPLCTQDGFLFLSWNVL